MMKMTWMTIFLGACLLVSTAYAQVDTDFILGYDFGNSGSFAFGESWVNPANATAGTFGSGSGMVLSSSGVGSTNTDPWASSSTTGDTGQRAWFSDDLDVSETEQDAYDNNVYVEFSITADTGYEITPSQIGFLALIDNTANSPDDYDLWISTDGFNSFSGTATASTTNLGNGNVTDTRSGASPQDFQLFTHNVSSISGDEITARVYWYGTGGSNAVRMDKAYMSGAVVIPEPSTLVMVGLALGAMLVTMRRRR
jgi:hypothetical protein